MGSFGEWINGCDVSYADGFIMQEGSGGGYGAVGQTWANDLIEHTAATAEAWRYSVLDAIGARESALGLEPVRGTRIDRHRARAGSTSIGGGRASSGRRPEQQGALFHGECSAARTSPSSRAEPRSWPLATLCEVPAGTAIVT